MTRRIRTFPLSFILLKACDASCRMKAAVPGRLLSFMKFRKKGVGRRFVNYQCMNKKRKRLLKRRSRFPLHGTANCGINPRQGFDGGVTAQEKSAPVKSGKEVGIILATNAPSFVNQFPWDTLAGQNGRATVGKAVAAFLKTIALSSRYSTRTGTEVKRVSAPGKPPLTLAGSGIEGFALDPPSL